MTAAQHSCILVVVDCLDDMIPTMSKVFQIAALVPPERHVGLKNLHVIGGITGMMHKIPMTLFGNPRLQHEIQFLPSQVRGWNVSLILERAVKAKGLRRRSMILRKMSRDEAEAVGKESGEEVGEYDRSRVYVLKSLDAGATLSGLRIPTRGLRTVLILRPSHKATEGKITIQQKADGKVIGGSTFVLRLAKPQIKHRLRSKR